MPSARNSPIGARLCRVASSSAFVAHLPVVTKTPRHNGRSCWTWLLGGGRGFDTGSQAVVNSDAISPPSRHTGRVSESKWVRSQRKAAESLFGATVNAWHGIEMAIRDKGPDGQPQFEALEVECLQLWRLELELAENTIVAVSTYQHNDLWGLQFNRAAEFAGFESDGIFRHRLLSELPMGEIEAVSIRRAVPHLDVAEVVLEIAGQKVILLAGEIEEHGRGRLGFRWMDESVLVFTDPAAIESTSWTPHRRFVERRTPYRQIDSAGIALESALASTEIGADVDDDELVRTLGIHVERVWRSEMQQFRGWPDGHTTDGSAVHVCYRPTEEMIEVLGVTWFDFGPEVFPFRARFSSHDDGQTKVIVSTEIATSGGGPRLYGGSPVVQASPDGEGTVRTASVITPGSLRTTDWVDVIELTESPALEQPPEALIRKIEHSIPWSSELADRAAVGATVGEILPEGFERYIRVFHPFVRWEAQSVDRTAEPRVASWSELASRADLRLSSNLTLRQLDASIEALEPELGRMAIWEGELEESTAEILYRTVDGDGLGPFRFAFGLSTIVPIGEPMLYETETLTGRVHVIDAVRDAGATRVTTAECVWPVDRRWIVFTDYDLTSSYVACSAGAADRLLRNSELETVVVDRATRIDDHADEQPRE